MQSSHLGMDSSYQNNSKAQTICHQMASQHLINSAKQIHQTLEQGTIVRIGVFGCGPGNNDLHSLEEYVIPHLPNRKVEIFMLDIVDTKWLQKTKKNNVSIQGFTTDLYQDNFPDSYLDLVVSFSCLHWFDKLPKNMIPENKFCYSLLTLNNQKLIKQTMKSRLDTFLQIRTRELKPGGKMVLTFDGEWEREPHHFQKISECVSEVLEKEIPEEYLTDFFILTCPRNMKEVKTSIDKIRNLTYSNSDIFIKHALCPFIKNREVKLTESIMACIKPNLEKYIPELQEKVRDLVSDQVSQNNYYSTEGNVLVMKVGKKI